MEYGFGRELYSSQKKFVYDAIRLIEDGKMGIFSSPTGTGKTLSLLCAATKFIRTQDDDLLSLFSSAAKTEVYYCSRTHSQLSQAINELKTSRHRYQSVVLGSRKMYCINEEVNRFSSVDVINDNCRQLVRENACSFYQHTHYGDGILDIEDLRLEGLGEHFCPYYFTKRKAPECDIVFLPYSLLFTKEGRRGFDIALKDKILIVDEAHNIYDTVIELNSAGLRWDELKMIGQARGLSQDLKVILSRLLDFHSKVKGECVLDVVSFLVDSKLCHYNMLEVSDFIEKERLAQKNDMKSVFEFSRLLRLFTFSDENGRIFVDKLRIRFTPTNPKMYFEEIRECRSVIFAGGTMEPITHLKSIFDGISYFTYPPVSENFVSMIIPETANKRTINLSFLQREQQIDDVINALVALTNPVSTGGIVIFVPSKYFLQIIKKNTRISNFRRKVYFEDETAFDSFKTLPEILVCVMGGTLSEGVNFSDDICRLLIVVGVPYPTKNLELDERSRSVSDYTSLVAMKTVNQAIGRAIRHRNDYAAIVLLDSRFAQLKDKLSPWVGRKTKICRLVDGLIQIHSFLKSQSGACA